MNAAIVESSEANGLDGRGTPAGAERARCRAVPRQSPASTRRTDAVFPDVAGIFRKTPYMSGIGRGIEYADDDAGEGNLRVELNYAELESRHVEYRSYGGMGDAEADWIVAETTGMGRHGAVACSDGTGEALCDADV